MSLISLFIFLSFFIFSWPFCSPLPDIFHGLRLSGVHRYPTPLFREAPHTYQQVLRDFKTAALKVTRRKPITFWFFKSLASSWDLWIFFYQCLLFRRRAQWQSKNPVYFFKEMGSLFFIQCFCFTFLKLEHAPWRHLLWIWKTFEKKQGSHIHS